MLAFYPKAVDSRLDTLRIEHQILSRHRLACGAFRVVGRLVAALHPPLRHLTKANAANLRRCHRHHGSQDNHGHLQRGLRHDLGLLDRMLEDQVSGFMVPCGLAGGGLGQRFLLELPRRGCRLHFPPLAIFLFELPAKILGFPAQPLFLPAAGLLFLLLVPSQTLLHGSLPRFQRPVERSQQPGVSLMALVPELDKRLQCSLDPLAQERDGPKLLPGGLELLVSTDNGQRLGLLQLELNQGGELTLLVLRQRQVWRTDEGDSSFHGLMLLSLQVDVGVMSLSTDWRLYAASSSSDQAPVSMAIPRLIFQIVVIRAARKTSKSLGSSYGGLSLGDPSRRSCSTARVYLNGGATGFGSSSS